MPIRGLTDKTSIIPRFPNLGKLRKGGKKGTNKIGKDLDYFRFTSERQDVEDIFKDIYGETPKMFRLYFPFPTPDENFGTWKEQWGSGRTLKHRCDGEKVIREYKGNKYHNYDQTPRDQRPDCPGGCKEVGRLTIILPELWKQGFIGYVTLETHSLHDLQTIMSSLYEAYQDRQEHGLDLRAMEFTLRRVQKTVSSPIEGKRAETVKNLIQLEPSVNWARLQIAASQQAEQRMLEAVNNGEIYPFPSHEEVDLDEEGPSSEIEPFSEDLIQTGRNLADQIEPFIKGIRQKFETLLETRIQKKGKEEMIIATDEDLQGVIDEMAILLQKKQSGALQNIYKMTEKFITEHRDALLKESQERFGEAYDFDKILSEMIECVNGAGKFIGKSFEDRRDGLQGIYENFSQCLEEKE